VSFLILIALGVLSVLVRAYLVQVMWSWFVVQFFGLPQLTLLVSVGIIYICSMVTGTNFANYSAIKDRDIAEVLKYQANSLVTYLIAFGFAWLFKTILM
jgi:hypothetical protein